MMHQRLVNLVDRDRYLQGLFKEWFGLVIAALGVVEGDSEFRRKTLAIRSSSSRDAGRDGSVVVILGRSFAYSTWTLLVTRSLRRRAENRWRS